MGHAQGLSMLYLEARCVSVVRAAGSQGVQNGSISCVALALSVPGGTRAILAENVLAAWLDLEVASGNDAIASHSPIRKTAKLMGQFLPGTDFVTSGLLGDAAPRQHVRRRQLRRRRHRRVAHDPARLAGRRRDRAGRARTRRSACASARPARAGRVRRARPAARDRRGGRGGDARLRQRATCPTATARPTSRPRTTSSRGGVSALDVALALDRRGFADVAEAVVGMLRQRVAADYLQTSAVIEPDGARPLGGQRPEPLPRARARATGSRASAGSCCSRCRTSSTRGGSAPREADAAADRRRRSARRRRGDDPAEVVVAVGPAFARRAPRDDQRARRTTTCSRRVLDGVREAGGVPRARPRAARRRRRLHRARRRAALRLGDRARPPVEGDGGDPPRRPPAARQPRAVRDEPALLARVATARWAATRPATRSAGGSGPCRRSSTTSRARS